MANKRSRKWQKEREEIIQQNSKPKLQWTLLSEIRLLHSCPSVLMLYPNQIIEWKRQLSERAAEVISRADKAEPHVDLKVLHAKIGQLTLENDFLESALTKGWIAQRKAMIDRKQSLSIKRQAESVGIIRGSVCYQPQPIQPPDLDLMCRQEWMAR